jgi:hypothetical protein
MTGVGTRSTCDLVDGRRSIAKWRLDGAWIVLACASRRASWRRRSHRNIIGPYDSCRAPRALATLALRCIERPRGWGGIQRGSGVALWRRGGPSFEGLCGRTRTTRDVNADFILNSGRRRFSPAAPSVATSTSTGPLRSSRGFCSRSFDRANPVRCRRHMRAPPPVAVCRD